MIRRYLFAIASIALSATCLTAQQDTEKHSALYQAQGEYTGKMLWNTDGQQADMHVGVQLVALANDKAVHDQLHLVLYGHGLPGAGWTRGMLKQEANGLLIDNKAQFQNTWSATLEDGILSFHSPDGEHLGQLKKITRASPTIGAKPPKDAVVLFDGQSAGAFNNGRLSKTGMLAAGCDSKQGFADHRIHLEFKTPFKPNARGQGRGNSGVYVQGRYECQILDSFGLDGKQNECGGVYSIAAPIVNACLPPETWQTYDIAFSNAAFDGDKKVRDARMTVHLNGILVHDDLVLTHATTAHRRPEGASPGGLYLQDHGNPVEYRNIWVVETDPQKTRKAIFLAGRRSHGYGSHEHKAGCMLLANALNESGLNIEATVIDIWPDDISVLDTADVIVSFADGGGGHPLNRHLGEMDALMSKGVGLVCIHYAVEVPKGPPGEHFMRWLGGYFETNWSVNPHWHANFDKLPTHAITRGVRPFAINDEWYFHMRFRPGMESVTPILSAVAPLSTMKRKDGPHSGNPAVRASVAAGEPQHLGWAQSRPDGGRSFGFTGAHVHWNWGHDDFRTVVLNAICWCAHMPIPTQGVPSATPSLKALQENQDNKPGTRFDAESVQSLLDSFHQNDKR